MSETPTQEDELAGTEQPFVQHLMELRDRLVKAIVAVGVVAAVLFFFPGPGALRVKPPLWVDAARATSRLAVSTRVTSAPATGDSPGRLSTLP